MALLFCDGMDAYSTVSDVPAKGWTTPTSAGVFSSSGGNYGGGSIGFSSVGANTKWIRANTFTYTLGMTLSVGFWFKQSAKPSGGGSGATGGTAAAGVFGLTTNVVVTVDTNGFLRFAPFGSSTFNAAAGTHNVCDNVYHWIEISILMETGATGTVTTYVDGVADLALTSLITVSSGSPNGQLFLGSGSNNGGAVANSFDDFIVWDASGSAFNTFPLGPRRIATLIPNGAGNSTQFTASTGTNWSCVAQGYSGTANVSDATTGKTDTYTTAGMAYTPLTTINAVVVNTYAINPAGDGTKSIIPKLRSGSSTVSGTTRTLPGSLTSYQDMFTADSSAAAWTYSSVNSAQPGVGD